MRDRTYVKQNMCMFLATMANLCMQWCVIPMSMCPPRTLFRIHHAYALEYDKPWLIEHYIQIFNMRSWLYSIVHASIFYEILETYMFFLQIPNM